MCVTQPLPAPSSSEGVIRCCLPAYVCVCISYHSGSCATYWVIHTQHTCSQRKMWWWHTLLTQLSHLVSSEWERERVKAKQRRSELKLWCCGFDCLRGFCCHSGTSPLCEREQWWCGCWAGDAWMRHSTYVYTPNACLVLHTHTSSSRLCFEVETSTYSSWRVQAGSHHLLS